jgi:hypothetical protein
VTLEPRPPSTEMGVDRSFTQHCVVITRIGSEAFADAIAVQRNGRIVVAGVAQSGPHSDIALDRYQK